MKKILTLLTLTFILFSCGDDGKPDKIKFKSGAYGSKAGQFVAEFPGEPKVLTQHFEAGSIGKYAQHSFQYNIASEHIYSVSYVDFPPELLKAWDNEQLFDQTIKTMTAQLGNFRISKKVDNPTKIYEKSITYTLNSSTPGEFIKSKFIRYEDRIYQILFMCRRRQPKNEKIDNFIESFKIYKPKESA